MHYGFQVSLQFMVILIGIIMMHTALLMYITLLIGLWMFDTFLTIVYKKLS